MLICRNAEGELSKRKIGNSYYRRTDVISTIRYRRILLYYGFSILLVFNRLMVFSFFGAFSGDLGFYYSNQHPVHHHFSSSFLSVG